jgi:replication factor C large subunit
MQPWINKHAPITPEQVPQKEVVKTIDHFINTFKKQKKKAMLLYGPPGSCKTCSVYAIANKHNLEVVEVNASDVRNAEQIKTRIGSAMQQQSLFSKGKIILIDEVDGVSGNKDRGGIQALLKLLATSKFPVICTANDPWDKKFSSLRKKTVVVECAPLTNIAILDVFKTIAEKESVTYDESALKTLARMSGGDLRAAINDLQTVTQNNEISKDAVDALSQRLQQEPIHAALLKIFKTTNPNVAVKAFNNIKENLDQCSLWVTENLPNEYTNPEDLASAFNAVSKASVYKGRIMRWQHWRFLVYVNMLLSAGVATAKKERYKKVITYKQTSRLLTMWMMNMKYGKRKALAGKLAEKMHISSRRAIQDVLPYLDNVLVKPHVAEFFDLSDDEIAYIRKRKSI